LRGENAEKKKGGENRHTISPPAGRGGEKPPPSQPHFVGKERRRTGRKKSMA